MFGFNSCVLLCVCVYKLVLMFVCVLSVRGLRLNESCTL